MLALATSVLALSTWSPVRVGVASAGRAEPRWRRAPHDVVAVAAAPSTVVEWKEAAPSLLAALEAGDAGALGEALGTTNGRRGLLEGYLAGPAADEPPAGLLAALSGAPQPGPTASACLMTMAMSVAASVAQPDEASQLTASRARALVRALIPRMPAAVDAAGELIAALSAARGAYVGGEEYNDDFINSWSSLLQMFSWDKAQLDAIAEAVEADAGGAAGAARGDAEADMSLYDP